MMAAIAERTERELPYERWNEERVRRDARDPAYTLAHNACVAPRASSGSRRWSCRRSRAARRA